MRAERELVDPVDIADADGRLRPEALGWARHPVQRWAPSGLSRVHAFDYWCVTTRTCALTVLVADVGVAGVALVSFVELASGRPIERVYLRPGGLPAAMPATPDGVLALDLWRLRLEVGPAQLAGEARTLTGRRVALDVAIDRAPGHETVNLVVPWSEASYHFTSKQQGLPVHGAVRVDGREHRLDGGFACRDYGRGRWPSGIDWCWAFAGARIGGRTIGINLGGRWTDAAPATENALVVDGRVHKIADDVDFTVEPWRIRSRGSDRVDLAFTPLTRRKLGLPWLVQLHQCVGSFSGRVEDVVLDDVIGVAETVSFTARRRTRASSAR